MKDAMVAWTHLGCQEEEDAVRTGSQFSSVAFGLADSTSSCGSAGASSTAPARWQQPLSGIRTTAYASTLLLVLVLRESG